MSRTPRLLALAATCCVALAPSAMAQSRADEDRFAQAQARFDSELATFRTEYDRYVQSRSRGGQGSYQGGYRDAPNRYNQGAYNDERDENGYDPARYYRAGPNYQERVLASDDRVYRGNDGKYYCKRNDGTTGLIIGAAGGGILGNVIDGGRSRTVGTLIGGALGALAGKSIDQQNSQVRCR